VEADPGRDGISAEFEAFGRTVVGSGCSGRHARDTLLLAADYLLIQHEATKFKDDLPTTHWFARQREAVGSESFVYACLELAACENILQWGFDETSLDGHSTFNQWCLVRRAGTMGIVTLECGCRHITFVDRSGNNRPCEKNVGVWQSVRGFGTGCIGPRRTRYFGTNNRRGAYAT
jgi:hypothetical protein